MGAIKPSTGSMMTHDKIADRAAEKLVRFIMIIITDEGIVQGRCYCCSSCGHYDAGREGIVQDSTLLYALVVCGCD